MAIGRLRFNVIGLLLNSAENWLLQPVVTFVVSVEFNRATMSLKSTPLCKTFSIANTSLVFTEPKSTHKTATYRLNNGFIFVNVP